MIWQLAIAQAALKHVNLITMHFQRNKKGNFTCTPVTLSISGKKLMLLVCMQYSDRIESESESEIKSNQVRTFSDKAAGENKGKHRRLLLE